MRYLHTSVSSPVTRRGRYAPYPDGRTPDGYTTCAMWLASRATRLGFTSDARFFKSYLRALEAQPRLEDPDLMVVRE